MRAIVLLCLLGAALALDSRYTWEGPGGTADPRDRDTNTENVCLTDKMSCGCCLMQQQMHRMEMFFNMSLNELMNSLDKTQNVLNNVRASRSAFSVALTDKRWCLGPFRDETDVVFKHVFINLGDNYNKDTGVFTVPRSGVYSLALTIYSDSGSPGNSLDACASIMVNNKLVVGPRDRNQQDQEDSATTVVALQLQAGDRVHVILPTGCFLCDSNSHFNTFTGFLLYSTD
ncbi:cerebellin 20 [Lampris incognitus]|uniref:cerebellin 20 n=1 Tax=Lampris incognitus TaxID=2546036 RepID=UPI0024B5E84E|nr:cerebellin 20 [Lampris incognitus]